MRLDDLCHNQLSGEAFAWYRRYLAALDAKDVQAFAAFLAPWIEMRFNNEPAVYGHAAVTAALAGYWQSFGTLEHDLLNIYSTDHAFMIEALNHYTKRRQAHHAARGRDDRPRCERSGHVLPHLHRRAEAAVASCP